MASVGTASNIFDRLKSLIPGGWFLQLAPIRYAVFGGLSDSLAAVYSLLTAVQNQTRIATASGWFLDLIAWDFFGPYFLRQSGEPDAHWRTRFTTEIFRQRITKIGIESGLVNLTGRTPQIFVPSNPYGGAYGYGCGALGYGGSIPLSGPVSGYGAPRAGYGEGESGYGVVPGAGGGSFEGVGCYADLTQPFTIFVTAYRPSGAVGIPNVNGYGGAIGGYGVGAIEYGSPSEIQGTVTDADIYACVEANVAAGITAWTALSD